MHFSIPETQEIKTGFKTYIAYNIYINGLFHCSLRYRQLYQFHLQLKKAFGAQSLPNFPPKKLLPLNQLQIEERRSQLERYVQIASQDSQIVNSDIFNGFLLAAQQESHQDDLIASNDCIDIFLLDWDQPIRLMVNVAENSNIVLKKFCQTIKLKASNISYFSLYLVYRSPSSSNGSKSDDYAIIRRLQNFESPLLTLRTIQNHKKMTISSSTTNAATSTTTSNMQNSNNYVIIIHKSYWDIAFDEDLYEDPVSLNINYLHALHNVEHGHIIIQNSGEDIKKKLNNFKRIGDKLEYLKLVRTQRFYGYVHFEPCHCDFFVSNVVDENASSKRANVKIYAGNQELIMRSIASNEEYVFRVIRIKCWRLTTSSSSSSSSTTSTHLETDNAATVNNNNKALLGGRFELSFEYLVSKDSLKWITIYSSQAVLISYCLQSMVEEMLLKREGKKFQSQGLTLRYNTSPNSNLAPVKKLNSNSSTTTSSESSTSSSNGSPCTNQPTTDNNHEWNYFRKDGSHVPLSSSSSLSATTKSSSTSSIKSNDSSFSSTTTSSSSDRSQNPNYHPLMVDGHNPDSQINLVENGVFDEIGDDDL